MGILRTIRTHRIGRGYFAEKHLVEIFKEMNKMVSGYIAYRIGFSSIVGEFWRFWKHVYEDLTKKAHELYTIIRFILNFNIYKLISWITKLLALS